MCKLSQQTQSFNIHDNDVHDTYENNNNNAFEKEKWPIRVSTPKTSFCYTHSKLRFFKAIKVLSLWHVGFIKQNFLDVNFKHMTLYS
jgi:hypothetical protein